MTRYFGAILLVGSVLLLLWLVRALLQPLLVAFLLAYILNPAVNLIQRRTRLGHNGTVNLVFVLFLASMILTVVLLVPPIVSQSQFLIEELQRVDTVVMARLATPVSLLGLELRLDSVLSELGEGAAQLLQPSRIFAVLQTTSQNLLWILVILVTTFYLLRDWAGLRDWLIALAPPGEQLDVRRLYSETKKIWQAYLRGQLVLMLLIGVLTSVTLLIIGLPGALAIGILTGLLDVILTVGPAVAMVIAALVAYFEGSFFLPLPNSWFALLVVGIYAIIQMAENVWLRPRVIGYQLNLHPALVFVAIMVTLTLFGVLVTLLIVPLMGTVALLGRYVRARLLNTNPWPEPTASSILELPPSS